MDAFTGEAFPYLLLRRLAEVFGELAHGKESLRAVDADDLIHLRANQLERLRWSYSNTDHDPPQNTVPPAPRVPQAA